MGKSLEMRKSLLVAGFGAFPGHAVNPAQRIVAMLARRKRAFGLAGIDLHLAVLPVEFEALSPLLSRLFAFKSPDAALLLGVAARRKGLTIETVARNRVSLLKPDAARKNAWSRFIVHGGPAVLPSPVPAARLAALARKSGLAAGVSRDAGDYLCNESLYLSLLMDRRAGFVHVPNWRGKRLERAARAVERMAKAFVLA
jgi:pyroglutamyl-peptidase